MNPDMEVKVQKLMMMGYRVVNINSWAIVFCNSSNRFGFIDITIINNLHMPVYENIILMENFLIAIKDGVDELYIKGNSKNLLYKFKSIQVLYDPENFGYELILCRKKGEKYLHIFNKYGKKIKLDIGLMEAYMNYRNGVYEIKRLEYMMDSALYQSVMYVTLYTLDKDLNILSRIK